VLCGSFLWRFWFEVFKEMPKELTKANCNPKHSCLQLLLIDVIFIWHSDKMLITLTALKIWRTVFGAE